jgi:hypothetical protein
MTIWRMNIACWIPKATNTHTQNIEYLLLFHSNNGCTNVPQCYVARTLSFFLGQDTKQSETWLAKIQWNLLLLYTAYATDFDIT